MEPADIDWKRIDSRFVPDELYEHINAPKWLDFAEPDAISVDDEAWFCRPDCKHPKTADDFFRLSATPSPKAKLLRSSSERLPFGERKNNSRDANNLKRRAAGIAPTLQSSPFKSKAIQSKNLREDFENQDPNMSTPTRTTRAIGAQKGAKAAKEMIKSSAQKQPVNEPEEVQQLQQKSQPRLKSTMSARNLFSGKDILGQISEFYNELKKMAAGRVKSPIKEETKMKKAQEVTLIDPAEKRGILTPKKDGGSGKKSNKMGIRVEVEKHKNSAESSALVKEVRAYPPTPQRFPSPSNLGLKSLKANPNSRSPLKPPKSSVQERKLMLEEVDDNKDEKTALLAAKEDGCYKSSLPAGSEEGNSVFWFLKPCTYLVN